MSAREELFSLASQDMPVSGAEVDEAIDAFAHELAERLHALRAIVPDVHKDEAWKDGYARAVEVAIALIDPMKEGA